MKDVRSRKKNNSFFRSRVFVVLLLLVLGLMVRATVSAFDKKAEAHKQELRLEKKYKKLQDRKEHYQSQIERLETPRGLEEEYRTLFNVVGEDEKMIKIIKDK